MVESYAMQDFRIIYKGTLDSKQLLNEMTKANLLLNFRDLNSCVNDFAFPSKVIECMASEVPLLTTKVIKDEQFSDATFILESYQFQDVNKAIENIKINSHLQKIKVRKARDYLITNHDWNKISKNLYEFLEKI